MNGSSVLVKSGPSSVLRRASAARFASALASCLLVAACGSSEHSPASVAAADGADTGAAQAADLSSGPHRALSSGGAAVELQVTDLDSPFPRPELKWIAQGERDTKNLSVLTNVAGSLEMSLLSSTRFDRGAFRFFEITYRVRNAPACAPIGGCAGYAVARRNATFVATMTSTTINQTAVSTLTKADGSAANPTLARALLPTNVPTPTSDVVDAAKASLQVFRESELPAAASGVISVFPYGFVVRNAIDGSRLLPASPPPGRFDGVVTFGFRLPLAAVASENPTTVAIRFQTAVDANTRVTQSLGEQNFAGDRTATARAMSLGVSPGSEDLVVLGGRVAQTTIGDPICRVRIAGPASTPGAFLVNHPALPLVAAAAPMNLEFVDPQSIVSVGFCENMQAPSASTLYVHGSQTGLRRVSGFYGGTLAGGGTSTTPNQLIWKTGRAFHPGEQVSFTVTAGSRSAAGVAIQPFSGVFRVRGSVAGSAGTLSAPVRLSSPGTDPAAFEVADVNQDGRLDAVFPNGPDSTVIVMPGDGTGRFGAPITSPAPFAGASWVHLADLNLDGKLDYVMVGLSIPGDSFASRRVAYALGNGSGGFGTPTTIDTGRVVTKSRLGDFNGDGRADLMIAGFDGSIMVFAGNGVGGFSAGVVVATVTAGSAEVAVADFNGDGRLDAALCYPSGVRDGRVFSVMLGRGDGTFTMGADRYPAPSRSCGITTGDLNGDGRPDIVLNGWDSSQLHLVPNLGGGLMGTATILSGLPLQPTAVEVADVNGDSRLDLVVHSQTSPNPVAVYLGDGVGGLGAPTVYPGVAGYGLSGGIGRVIDFDRDGRLDYIGSGARPSGGPGEGGFKFFRGL